MRTIYLGDTYRHHNGQRTYRQTHEAVNAMREPEGDDMPVFDRRETGYRGEYERPARYSEEDAVWVSNPNR